MKELPILQKLQIDPQQGYNLEQFQEIINTPTPKQWVKTHPFTKVKYVPIERHEHLMDRIFQQWRVEVKDYKQIVNSITVCVRVHYIHPVTGEWSFHDGVGAMDIETAKGAKPTEYESINSFAIMKALPAAKSYAIKDACEHLGELFGRSINRKDVIAFEKHRVDLQKSIEEMSIKVSDLIKEVDNRIESGDITENQTIRQNLNQLKMDESDSNMDQNDLHKAIGWLESLLS